jgi:hypothetical protein
MKTPSSGRRYAGSSEFADREPHAALGVFSSALFLIALAVTPFAVASLTQSLAQAGAFSFTLSQASLEATSRALHGAAAALAGEAPDRRAAWNDMVIRELAEGDEAAARGLMLSAGDIVGREAQAVQAARDRGDEAAAMLAARTLLDGPTQNQALEAGLFAPIQGAPMIAAGDARDLAVQARAWLDGRGAALSELVLTGVSVAAPELAGQFGLSAAALQSGVISLKAALRSGRVQPNFLAEVQSVLQAADQDGALAARLREGFAAEGALADEPGAARAAFVASLGPSPAWRAITDLLLQVDALNAKVGWTGTVQLLAQAETLQDLQRISLLAEAGGPSAVAVAKRMPDPAAFLALARADFALTGAMQAAIALIVLLFGVIVAAPLVTLVHAVLRIWGAGSGAPTPSLATRRQPARSRRPDTDDRLAA